MSESQILGAIVIGAVMGLGGYTPYENGKINWDNIIYIACLCTIWNLILAG